MRVFFNFIEVSRELQPLSTQFLQHEWPMNRSKKILQPRQAEGLLLVPVIIRGKEHTRGVAIISTTNWTLPLKTFVDAREEEYDARALHNETSRQLTK